MKLPDLPRDGRPVHETVRDLINYLRAITVTNVKGGRVMRSANGTTLIFKPGKSSVVTATSLRPLTIKAGTDVDLIQIVPGTVNSQYPTISATSINADPAPEITVSAATTYAWIKCVGTFGGPDTYALTIETTTTTNPPASPAISSTGFTTCFFIGYVTFADGAITGITNEYGGGNMGVESFGSVNLWWSL